MCIEHKNKSRVIIKDVVCCNERIKRKVVEWKKESGAEGKDFIEY